MSRWVSEDDGRSSASSRSSQSRISLNGARSSGKSGERRVQCPQRTTEFPRLRRRSLLVVRDELHSVIHNPSRSYGPGGRRSLGGTTSRSARPRKAPTATSRASHRSASSCSIAVPVITRATTGAGFRCTRPLPPAAISTASSQATPCSRATACAASTKASPAESAVIAQSSPVRVVRAGRLVPTTATVAADRVRRPEQHGGLEHRLLETLDPGGQLAHTAPCALRSVAVAAIRDKAMQVEPGRSSERQRPRHVEALGHDDRSFDAEHLMCADHRRPRVEARVVGEDRVGRDAGAQQCVAHRVGLVVAEPMVIARTRAHARPSPLGRGRRRCARGRRASRSCGRREARARPERSPTCVRGTSATRVVLSPRAASRTHTFAAATKPMPATTRSREEEGSAPTVHAPTLARLGYRTFTRAQRRARRCLRGSRRAGARRGEACGAGAGLDRRSRPRA